MRAVPENMLQPFTTIVNSNGTSNGVAIPGIDANALYACATATDDAGNWLIAIVNDPNVSQLRILKSTDDGVTWSPVSPTATPTGYFHNLRITTNKTGRWWLHTGVSNTMYYSDNIGTSWVAMTPPSTALPSILKYENGSLFFASSVGTTYSSDVSSFVTVGYQLSSMDFLQL